MLGIGGGGAASGEFEFGNLPGLGLTLRTTHECDTKHPTGWEEFAGAINAGGDPSIASALMTGGGAPGGTYIRYSMLNAEDLWTPRYLFYNLPANTKQLAVGWVGRISLPSATTSAPSYLKGVSARITSSGIGADNWWGWAPPATWSGSTFISRTAAQADDIAPPTFTNQTGSQDDYVPDLNSPAVIDQGTWFKLEAYLDVRVGFERMMCWWNGTLISDTDNQDTSTYSIANMGINASTVFEQVKGPVITIGGGSGLPTLTSADYSDIGRIQVYSN